MRILHIVSNFSENYGGIAEALKSLSSTQQEKGNEVAVIAAMKSNEVNRIFNPNNVEVIIVNQDIIRSIWNSHSFQIKNEICRVIDDYDVVHIHGIWHHPSYVAAKIASMKEIPYVISTHGSLEPWCLEYKKFKKIIYYKLIQEKQLCKASIIHALTKFEYGNIKKLLPQVKIKIIPNGIYLPKILKEKGKNIYTKKYEYLIGKKIVLFLGRIHPIKGLDILIKGFAKAKKEEKSLILVIAGHDEIGWKKKLEKIADKCEVNKSVFFIDFIEGEEKQYMLEKADIFIMPSHSEGFSVAILEAMSFSKPVIISKGCNFPEVEKEGAGIIVDTKEEEIAKAIIKLALDGDLAKSMGENARNFVVREYTWDKIADRTIEMYKEAIGAGGS